MDSKLDKHYCRVCGYFYGEDYFPWGEGENSPTFDICICCGVEFGYEDCDLEGIKAFRKQWLGNGNPWRLEKFKPVNWSVQDQLKNIPKKWGLPGTFEH